MNHGTQDRRNIIHGWEIPTESYADQPYVVKTDDGAWLCVVTTGAGREGQPGQHIVTLRSLDSGRTWSEPTALEPPDGVEASYAVLLKIPSGRVYCFYNHNTDNIREVIGENPPYKDGFNRRVDSLGHFVYKYSDDHGVTWSDERTEIVVREMEIDRENPYQGKIQFFWNVGRPFLFEDVAYVSLHKVGSFGAGFFTRSEGVLLKCDNICEETDPTKLNWETLPEGEKGLRAPEGGGRVSEEHSYTVLGDGAFYSVYRTIDGHPTFAYSRDRGRVWTEPQYKRYADGRLVKHPRAANFVWKCENGKYIYWYHNHGGRFILEHPERPSMAYQDRNPAWGLGGVEVDTPEGKVIRWSQPEILLYHDDPLIRMSYPDMVEEEGEIYLTETEKHIARTHRMDRSLIEGMWRQVELHEGVADAPAAVAREGLALEAGDGNGAPATTPMAALEPFVMRDSTRKDYGTRDTLAGFTLEAWVDFESLGHGQCLFDTRTEDGRGICLRTTVGEKIELIMNDGRCENRWTCDGGLLEAGRDHHIAVMVDGGPRLIMFMVDGRFCDGGDERQFGWGRFSPHLRDVNGTGAARLGEGLKGSLKRLRLYRRCLRTAEAYENFAAGVEAEARGVEARGAEVACSEAG